MGSKQENISTRVLFELNLSLYMAQNIITITKITMIPPNLKEKKSNTVNYLCGYS